MIDKNKTYKTKNGKEVRIYATDGEGPYPIHGAYKVGEGWVGTKWTEEGLLVIGDLNHSLDLVEGKPRVKKTVWVNVYRNGVYIYPSKVDAKPRGPACLACVKIEIDVEEGHGLDTK